MNDEREQLREERDQLREQVRLLLAEKTAAENIAKYGFGPDESEREALDAILFAFTRITKDWRIRTNTTELAAAVHVLQGFVIQHMLSRLAPEQWGSWWWKEDEVDEDGEPDGVVRDAVPDEMAGPDPEPDEDHPVPDASE